MNAQPKPNALGLPSSTTSSNATASPSAAQARRPSATPAGSADQQLAAQAQLAQTGVSFAQSEAALIPPENAKPKPASGSGAAAAPDTKSAAPDLKTAAVGGPGSGASAAQLPSPPKIHFVNFDTGGPAAAEYPKRFAPGMNLAQTEAVLADIRRAERRELGAVFDAHGRLARVTLGVAAKEGDPASVDLGALIAPDAEHGAIPAKGQVVTHSHPQGRPLSVGDLHAFTLKGFREIRAVGFCTYTMTNTGQASGEHTVMPARDAYSAGMQAWASEAATILGGRLLTLESAGKEDVTVDLGDTSQLPGAAMEEFLGCTRAASAMGWTFTCSIGNDAATYLRHVIQQRWPGYRIAPAKGGAAPKPVGGGSAAAAKDDTGRRGPPPAAAPTAQSGAGKKPVKPVKPVKPGQVGVSREW